MRTLTGRNGGSGARGSGARGSGALGSAAVAGLLWAVAASAMATEPPPTATPPIPVAGSDATRDPATSAVDGIGKPIATVHLDRLRGGDASTTNHIDVDGEVSGNSADNTVSGMNLVDGGSFGNAAGISTVIQNSGNNVLIQNAMIVNVQFADPVP